MARNRYNAGKNPNPARTGAGLTRAVRELVLAEGSGASGYVKQQAQEIEALAAPLREAPNE